MVLFTPEYVPIYPWLCSYLHLIMVLFTPNYVLFTPDFVHIYPWNSHGKSTQVKSSVRLRPLWGKEEYGSTVIFTKPYIVYVLLVNGDCLQLTILVIII